jgi:hypothetical protein
VHTVAEPQAAARLQEVLDLIEAHKEKWSLPAAAFGSLRPLPWYATTFTFGLYSEEDATYTAGLYRVSGPSLGGSLQRNGTHVLAGLSTAKAKPTVRMPVLNGRPSATVVGTVKAYFKPTVTLRTKGAVKPGWYVYAVKLHALANPARAVTFVSRPFQVTAKAAKTARPTPKGKAGARPKAAAAK